MSVLLGAICLAGGSAFNPKKHSGMSSSMPPGYPSTAGYIDNTLETTYKWMMGMGVTLLLAGERHNAPGLLLLHNMTWSHTDNLVIVCHTAPSSCQKRVRIAVVISGLHDVRATQCIASNLKPHLHLSCAERSKGHTAQSLEVFLRGLARHDQHQGCFVSVWCAGLLCIAMFIKKHLSR